MSTEIPIWVNGTIRWVSGIDKKTTCKDVVEVLLVGEGMDKSEGKDFAIMERWRRVERPLDENSKILKVWSHWGDEKKEVRLCLKRIDNEVDSGRGSPVGAGNTPSLRRRRHHRSRANGKPPWSHHETLHPRRLAELGRFTKEDYEEYQTRKSKHGESSDCKIYNEDPIYDSRHCNYGEKIYGRRHDVENCRKKSGHKSYHCSNTGMLHSTLLAEHQNPELYSKPQKCCSKRTSKPKVRNSENIEKLMKLILAQGATIQNQLLKLKEREEQIETMEHERHKERVEKNGRNYLLETYLGSLQEAEIPNMNEVDEEKGNDSGVHTEGGSDQMNIEKEKKERLREKETEHPKPGSSRRGRLKHQQEEKEESDRKRSKSESRTQDVKVEECEKNLKRAKSENILVDEAKAKEVDDTLELRRIQSQVEMWEKVFKINKKLEKEEENLVRLHIKIKRFQLENFKLAKDVDNDKEVTKEPPADCQNLQKNLETLRVDLDQNSKEIYQNFTKLIENDEVVEQKRSYLTKLMTDLERTEQEHEMLNEMVTIAEQECDQDDLITSFCEEPNDDENIGISLQVKGQEIIPETIPTCQTPLTSHNQLIPRNLTEEMMTTTPLSNQRCEIVKIEPEPEQIKPKTVKISFDDQIRNVETCEPQEKFKEPHLSTPGGAIKGILKNRNRQTDKIMDKCNLNIELHHFKKCTVDYGSNIDEKRDKTDAKDFNLQPNPTPLTNINPNPLPLTNINPNPLPLTNINPNPLPLPNRYHYPQDIPEGMYNIYSYPVNTAYNNPIYGENNYTNPKNLYSSKIQHPGIHRSNIHSGSVVTTKAVIHNDTDSSTSSDTSGLSSMYSSSPTVEEPYAESGYVLDTLV